MDVMTSMASWISDGDSSGLTVEGESEILVYLIIVGRGIAIFIENLVVYCRRADLKRAILLASIVGSWLVFFNHGSVILLGALTPILYLGMVLDYATPFILSSLTGILRNRNDRQQGVISFLTLNES